VNGLALLVPLLVGYLAGRFLERIWLRWGLVLLSVIGPVAIWVARSGLLAGDPFGVAMVFLIVLAASGEMGVALLCCMIGRSQRLQA